jgi:hypothetical protein
MGKLKEAGGATPYTSDIACVWCTTVFAMYVLCQNMELITHDLQSRVA